MERSFLLGFYESLGQRNRFNLKFYFAALGVRAMPSARDKRVLLRVLVVLDTYSFREMYRFTKSFVPGGSWLNKIHSPVEQLAAMHCSGRQPLNLSSSG